MKDFSAFSDGREPPDRRYWTEYDHFMVEREAHALRDAHLVAFVARSWTAAKRLLARFLLTPKRCTQ